MARILTIDDDPDQLVLLRTILRIAGHEALPLMNAADAVRQIREARPDLVITDVMMPGVSGGTVYAGIRSEIGGELPVIVSSSTSLKVSGGKNDPLLAYVHKPVDSDKLTAEISRLLSLAAARRADDGQPELDAV